MAKSLGKGRVLIPLLCIAPAFLMIVLFKLAPIASTVGESFFHKAQFGLANYQNIAEDPMFWNSLWVTLKFNIITTPSQILLALGMALLVNEKVRGVALFRTIYYLPVTISMTIATLVWGLMLNPNNGLLNGLLAAVGIPRQPFLTSADQALWCVALIATWKGVGFWMMFLLAGLQNIGQEIYEAARVDGANWGRTTIGITMPLLKPSMLYVVVADTTANLLMFAPMYMITKGGPMSSTNVIMYEAYKSTFLYVDRERGAAMVTVLLIMIALVVALLFYVMGERRERSKGVRL